jgi:hypothetical protein
MPAAHVSVPPQTRPQAPQFAAFVVTSMQVAPHIIRGAPQVVMQAPAEQPSVAAQTWPQVPQLLESERMSLSHPLAESPSQSAKPLVQPTTAQDDAMHAGTALGSEQAAPHALQFVTEVLSEVSQPLAALPSQSP